MKKILIPIFCLGVAISAQAEGLFQQLVTFNPNWKSYEARVTEKDARAFSSDKEYIQMHLTHVLEILRSNTTDALNCEQLETRQELIDVLEGYKNRGLFPMNYYRTDRIPVFIDEHNTHCAVGYLLKESGYDHVAKRIAASNNYAWVKEIHDPALPVWQEFSGFTLAELKLIQGAYDSYHPFALSLPNRLEIPQKPDVLVLNFDGSKAEAPSEEDLLSVWCYGQGKDSVLHGRWIQNSGEGIPWIVGYFENGNRTGSWKEYYQGTEILCRTEHWRDDKLNGVRTRYDREGNVIERITFKDGEAVQKINYDLQGGIEWIRKPLDSITLKTEAYSLSGYLLASGTEQVYNPSGRLQWFQDIELTALNTFAISARDGAPEYTSASAPHYISSGRPMNQLPPWSRPRSQSFSQMPALVNYQKIGEWKYYNEYSADSYTVQASTASEYLEKDYPHFGKEIVVQFKNTNLESMRTSFDSLQVKYDQGKLVDFHGFKPETSLNVSFLFKNGAAVRDNFVTIHSQNIRLSVNNGLVGIGELNEKGERVGDWVLFDENGQMTQYVKYVQPFREEEPLTGSL